jgi:hypothetical protein
MFIQQAFTFPLSSSLQKKEEEEEEENNSHSDQAELLM